MRRLTPVMHGGDHGLRDLTRETGSLRPPAVTTTASEPAMAAFSAAMSRPSPSNGHPGRRASARAARWNIGGDANAALDGLSHNLTSGLPAAPDDDDAHDVSVRA